MALPHTRRSTLSLLISVSALAACGGSEQPLGPGGGTFVVGQSAAVVRGQEMRVVPGATDGEFIAVVANVALDSNTHADFALRGDGLGAPPAGSTFDRIGASRSAQGAAPLAPSRDAAFESALRERERVDLTPRFAAARSWNASRVPSLPVSLSVGDLVTANVNALDPCTNPVRHALRVVAIGVKALVLADTLNPKPGFTTADFQRFAARFDTLVYPLDVAAFGEPTDIDRNGRIAIVFTRSVNELTPRNATTYVGGLTFSRDLFPQTATSRTQACQSSNEGEFFYMMAPDPAGIVNGNRRTNGFVDTNTTAVLAHELVHLINASRKLYVNTAAPKFEEKWLDEGLAHVAEELLFYRESGLAPRSNIDFIALSSSPRSRAAYFTEMGGNAARYRDFISSTGSTSPYSAGDPSVPTRGATWSLLRYLTDRVAPTDGDIWNRLVNNTAIGAANLQSVYGRDLVSMIRDWQVSLATDDFAATGPELQQRSWNWRYVFAGSEGVSVFYPLKVTPMTTATSYTGTVVAGGSSYYRLSVPANSTATLSLGGQSGAAGSNLQLVIVRTK
ncbi:MAG TPA: hypothetical protein VGP25_19180 [Gemmatimonadaceae bacterium]|nr:hypothetical protein [Gemmatimonadaceae bacterium]